VSISAAPSSFSRVWSLTTNASMNARAIGSSWFVDDWDVPAGSG
jgi:hypothetical protein